MNNKSYRILLMGAFLLLAGCVARTDPLFSKYILAADRAIEDARKRGVDKQDPAKFQELVKLRDDAEQNYMACIYYKAQDMMREVVQRASLLKGLPKVAAKPKMIPAPPKPVKATAAKPIKFLPVLFDFDRYTIKTKFYPVLDQSVFILKASPRLQMIVEGHADSVGTIPYNQALSEKRAGAVLKYIEKKGVSKDRLTAKGFGEEEPVASNSTKEGRAINRRVMLKPVGKIQGKSVGEN